VVSAAVTGRCWERNRKFASSVVLGESGIAERLEFTKGHRDGEMAARGRLAYLFSEDRAAFLVGGCESA
jgi:hypothetical protein